MFAHKLSALSANQSVAALAALLNSGWIDLYDGPQPATADALPSTETNHILASLQFAKLAFKPPHEGVSESYPLLSDPNARHTGTAAWYRLSKTDHTTVVSDGSIGDVNMQKNHPAEKWNLMINSAFIQENAEVSINVFTLMMGKG